MTLTLEMADERVDAVIRALDSHSLTDSSRFTLCVPLSNGLRWPRFRINSQSLETPALAGLIFVSILSYGSLGRVCGDESHHVAGSISVEDLEDAA
jgi:hypothetical protein